MQEPRLEQLGSPFPNVCNAFVVAWLRSESADDARGSAAAAIGDRSLHHLRI